MGVLCLTHVDLVLADSSRPFWRPGNNGCRSLKLPPREAIHFLLLFGAGSLSLSVGNETAPAAPLIGSPLRMTEGDGRTAACTPLLSFSAPMVTLRMRANSQRSLPGWALS